MTEKGEMTKYKSLSKAKNYGDPKVAVCIPDIDLPL